MTKQRLEKTLSPVAAWGGHGLLLRTGSHFHAGALCSPASSDDLEECNLTSPRGTVSHVDGR